LLFNGIQFAGPQLTPTTFAAGVRKIPAVGGSAMGQVTTGMAAWTRPDDYTQPEDITEIWWDANTVGPDSTGRVGKGLYRFIAGGRRYTMDRLPTGVVPAFVADGTVTGFAEPPPTDKQPDYPKSTCKGPTRADCVGAG
jgi:hypothetical protein